MNVDYKVLYAPKFGAGDFHGLEGIEDAYALQGLSLEKRKEGYASDRLDIPTQWCCCISDGITNGWQTKHWAELLVTSFVAAKPVMRADLRDIFEWVQSCAEDWHHIVVPELRNLAEQGTETRKWRFEEGLRRSLLYGDPKFRPTAATLVALNLNTTNRTWEAVSIGDSCLFHVRNNELQGIRPAYQINSAEFDNTPPALLFTSPERNHDEYQRLTDPDYGLTLTPFVQGRFQLGDQFILMTDSAAKWFLQLHEKQVTGFQGERPFDLALAALNQIRDEKELHIWLSQKREQNQIVDDDITIVILTVSELPTNEAVAENSERGHFFRSKSRSRVATKQFNSRALEDATKQARELLMSTRLPEGHTSQEAFRQISALLSPFLREILAFYLLYASRRVSSNWRTSAVILGILCILQFIFIIYLTYSV